MTTSFNLNRTKKENTKASELITVNNKKTNFMSTLKTIILCIAISILVFLTGYILGTISERDKKVSEVEYSLSADYGLDDWQILQMAIIKTESDFNSDAIGKTNDCGIFQITPIYVKDVNRLSEKQYQISDAFDVKKSLEMFSIMQSHYNSNYDIDKAVKLHNPNGKAVNYASRVYNNIVFIKRMEEVRKEVLVNKFYKNDNIILTEADNVLKDDTIHVKATYLSSKPVDKIKIK